MEALIGEERSNIMRREPSFLGTAPNGEQWNGEKGGDEKGPAVWLRDNSLEIALETGKGLEWADWLFRTRPGEIEPR